MMNNMISKFIAGGQAYEGGQNGTAKKSALGETTCGYQGATLYEQRPVKPGDLVCIAV